MNASIILMASDVSAAYLTCVLDLYLAVKVA